MANLVPQLVPIIVGVLVALSGRFSDLGRKRAREVKQLRAANDDLIQWAFALRRVIWQHNATHPDDDQIAVPATTAAVTALLDPQTEEE